MSLAAQAEKRVDLTSKVENVQETQQEHEVVSEKIDSQAAQNTADLEFRGWRLYTIQLRCVCLTFALLYERLLTSIQSMPGSLPGCNRLFNSRYFVGDHWA